MKNLIVIILAMVATNASAVPVFAIALYNNDFEGPVGSEWSNTSTDVTPIGGRGFLGQFGNETVTLSLDSLPSHTDMTVSFDLFVIRTWDGNDLTNGPDRWMLEVSGGPTLLDTTFRTANGGSQAYPGSFPGGVNPPNTGAAEVNTLGYNHPLVSIPFNAVYHITTTFLHSADDLNLDFLASGLQALSDESWGLDNVEVEVTLANTSVPEPVTATLGLMGLGVLSVATRRRWLA